MNKRLSRRTLLRGAGGAALALPFLEAMSARADELTIPKRIIFFMSFNGAVMDRWKCQVNPSDDSDFVWSEILEPLAPIKDDCLILEGVPMNSSYDAAQQATAHQGGAASCLTGTWAGPGQMDGGGNQLAGYAVSESIDHALAQDIGADTKFPAYYFGVIPTASALITRVFYEGQDQPITPNANPFQVNSDVFGQLSVDPAVLQKRLRERETVLDALMEDIGRLECRLGGDDRVRLDQHLTQVREIEKRLYLGPGNNPACAIPDLGGTVNHFDHTLIPTLGELQMDQVAMALTCDLTRVAGLQWISPVNGVIYSWLGHTEMHHDLSHQTTDYAKDRLVEINRWYAEQLVYLVNKLKSIPEGTGTLFDSTLIVWAQECGDPWTHDRQDVPWVLVGHQQNHFRTGRYLRFQGDSHNRLLLNIFAAMGAPRPTFGAPAYCDGGPLPGLT